MLHDSLSPFLVWKLCRFLTVFVNGDEQPVMVAHCKDWGLSNYTQCLTSA